MIVRMKKLHIIVQKKDVHETLEVLQGLGVVHVERESDVKSDHLIQLKEELSTIQNAIRILENSGAIKDVDMVGTIENWRDKVDDILELAKHKRELSENIIKRNAYLDTWKDWGDFNAQELKDMEERGIYSCLCELPKKEMNNLPQGVCAEVIHSKAGVNKCLLLSSEKIEGISKTIDFPKNRLNEIVDLKKREQIRLDEIEHELAEHAKYLDILKRLYKEKEDECNLEGISAEMNKGEELSWLKGFCPVDLCEKVQDKAKQEHWGILVEEPKEEDSVPTLIRNPKWVEIIKPVFNMIGVVPGYKEIDSSALFLIFFAVFVGMLVGDAGYGLLIAGIIGTTQFLLRKKIAKPTIFILGYILCAMTVLWGVLTGVYFGQQWVSSVIPPVIPWLSGGEKCSVALFFHRSNPFDSGTSAKSDL
jgi:V/A-type H+-transporting ATPase subunit I